MVEVSEIDALSLPEGDGEVLVWPKPEAWVGLVEQNRLKRLRYSFRILGRTVAEWCDLSKAGRPIVMTGHQPELLHPGVWIKNAVSAILAERVNGDAEFVTVDSDTACEPIVRWPVQVGDECQLREIPIAAQKIGRDRHLDSQKPGVGTAASRLGDVGRKNGETALPMADEVGQWSYWHWPPMDGAACRVAFDAVLQNLPDGHQTPLPAFADGFCASGPTAAKTPRDYVDQWINGLVTVDCALGLPILRYTRASAYFAPPTPRMAALLAHVLLDAEAFAGCYNAAIKNDCLTQQTPANRNWVPTLHRDAERTELPLWLLRADRPRARLAVSRVGGSKINLWAGSECVASVGRDELRTRPGETLSGALGGWWILPRALFLTMSLRLLECDLFIHGLGGARYDQITDRIIRDYFHAEPPGIACISATLHWPLGLRKVSAAEVAAARRKIRDVRYNPQRYLARCDETLDALALRRTEAIREAERLRQENPRAHAERRGWFERIRELNARFLGLEVDLPGRLESELAAVEHLYRAHGVASRRDWFFALHSIERLKRIIENTRLNRVSNDE